MTLSLSLNASASGQPSSLQWTLDYSTVDFTSASVTAGPAATSAGKSITCDNVAGAVTCIVWGWNTSAIPNGVVATVTLTLSNSNSTSSTVQLTDGSAANTTAASLPVAGNSGQVTILQAPRLNGFTCNPISVAPPGSTTCTLALTAAAQTPGATIALNAAPADANLPATITVPQGATSTTFTATPGSVATPTPVTLTASYLGVQESFGLTVNPAAAVLSSIAVSPSVIASTQSANVTINLTAPAGSGGVVVSLSSSNGSATGVPSAILVQPGSTLATFSVIGGSVNISTPAVLTASYSGVSKTANLTINPPTTTLNSITVNPGTISSGQTASGTVSLTGPASAGGAMVSLLSSNPTVASVPSAVMVQPGSTSATFNVICGTVNAATSVVLTSSYGVLSKNANLTVTAHVPQAPTAPANLSATAAGTSQINLNWSASTSGIGINHYVVQRCQGMGCLSFTQIGTAAGTFSDTALKQSTSYSYRLQAVDTAGNLSPFSNIATAATQASSLVLLRSITINRSTVAGGDTATGTVTLTGSAGVNGVVVALTTSNPSIATVPSNVTIPSGSSSATFSIQTQRVRSTSSLVLIASYSGVSKSASLTVKRHH